MAHLAVLIAHGEGLLRAKGLLQELDHFARVLDRNIRSDGVVSIRNRFDCHANLLHREKTLGSQPKEKGARNVVTKAVLIGQDGKEEIVGAAGWSFHLGREDGTAEEEKGSEEGGKGEELENGSGGWGEGANVKLCEDVFLGAEKIIVGSTEGRNFASGFKILYLLYYETD